jgi:hypothetical protein
VEVALGDGIAEVVRILGRDAILACLGSNLQDWPADGVAQFSLVLSCLMLGILWFRFGA